MPKISKPRAGSRQFWPRKRAERILPSVNWNILKKESGLKGFIGYKAGMVSVYVKDDTADSMSKGKKIIVPATVIECPPLKIYSVRFYKNNKVNNEIVFSSEKELKRILKTTKNVGKVEDLDKVTDFEDLRIIVYSEVKKTGIKKSPDVAEIGLGGTKEQKLSFVKEKIGKSITVSEVFSSGLIDVRGVTKGKGLQGPVKRHGISLKVMKTEKGQRRPGSLAPWHPARVLFLTPMAGQMGFFTRTHYNHVILRTDNAQKNPIKKDGFEHYGQIKNDYIVVKGSVLGPQKRQLLLTAPLRASKKQLKKKLEVLDIR